MVQKTQACAPREEGQGGGRIRPTAFRSELSLEGLAKERQTQLFQGPLFKKFQSKTGVVLGLSILL